MGRTEFCADKKALMVEMQSGSLTKENNISCCMIVVCGSDQGPSQPGACE